MRLGGLPHIRGHRSEGWWLARAIRGARLDRNPLRRGTDRVETCLVAGLFVAAAAGAPFAAQAASHAVYASALQARQEQLATRHEVPAVLTASAPTVVGYAVSTTVLTAATWTSVTGIHRSGDVPAAPGSLKGTAVTVWSDDRSGYLDSPPITMAEAADQSDAAMVGAIVGAGLACLGGAGLVAVAANRRRMAAWEGDWRTTAPTWNRQRW